MSDEKIEEWIKSIDWLNMLAGDDANPELTGKLIAVNRDDVRQHMQAIVTQIADLKAWDVREHFASLKESGMDAHIHEDGWAITTRQVLDELKENAAKLQDEVALYKSALSIAGKRMEELQEELKQEIAENDGVEGRCKVGHHKKFSYMLNEKAGCVACERDQAASMVEELRLQLATAQKAAKLARLISEKIQKELNKHEKNDQQIMTLQTALRKAHLTIHREKRIPICPDHKELLRLAKKK